MRYFIIAGEASGNNYARRLIQELKISDQQAEIKYFGPDADSAVMGFIEVLTKAPALLRRLNVCRKKILEYRPDVLILIDYPTFNLKMASYARKHGIKTFYYIAPKVWASREWRIRKIKNNVDRLYVIFPFEKEYFASKGIDAVYLGNPLLDHMQSTLEKTDSPDVFRAKFKLGPEPTLTILP
ncbi:MAG: lipid-A-disaccharide synthase, partial [Bacteroidales bacterium]